MPGRAARHAAEAVGADLTVVGPEAPLVAGVVDEFRARGLKIVGPDAEAAQLEGSKIFAKNFFVQSGIPTAAFETVEDAYQARMALERFGFPVVLKADGLAAGKGVVIAQNARGGGGGARDAARTDGDRGVSARRRGQLHRAVRRQRRRCRWRRRRITRRVFDGDQGPNTGGMGAYCDSRILSDAETRMVLDRVIYPTVQATDFTGFLYAGLMMTADGPKVLEFNVRLGDPETQPLMHRMTVRLRAGAAGGGRGTACRATQLEWNAGPSVCVVMASAGYPGSVRDRQGDPRVDAGGAARRDGVSGGDADAARAAGDRGRARARSDGVGRGSAGGNLQPRTRRWARSSSTECTTAAILAQKRFKTVTR